MTRKELANILKTHIRKKVPAIWLDYIKHFSWSVDGDGVTEITLRIIMNITNVGLKNIHKNIIFRHSHTDEDVLYVEVYHANEEIHTYSFSEKGNKFEIYDNVDLAYWNRFVTTAKNDRGAYRVIEL